MKKRRSLYLCLRFLGKIFLKIFFRVRIDGGKIPKSGGLIVAVNHISPMDPPLIGIVFPRIIHFFAAEELLNIPVIGWFIKNFGAIPVKRRRGDPFSLKKAVELLKNGEVVGIFPQGGIPEPMSSSYYKIKPGVAYLSLKADVPILPICISGTDRIIPRGKAFFRRVFTEIHIRYGEVIYPDRISFPSLEKKREIILEKLKEEMFACESAYSGR